MGDAAENIPERDFGAELKELREMINLSSQHTQRQVENINTNPLIISALISLIFGLGVSFALKILVYWIPASFLLIVVWSAWSIRSPFKSANKLGSVQQATEQINSAYQKIGDKRMAYSFKWIFKNLASGVKALGLVFAVTAIVSILISANIIPAEISFPTILPIASASVYLVEPFLLDGVIKFFAEGQFKDMMNRQKISRAYALGFGSAALIFSLLMVGLPLWTLWVTHPLYYPIGTGTLFLFVVLILQLIVLALLIGYLSAISAKRELMNTVTNFASLDYRINDIFLSKDTLEKYEDIKNAYLTAKEYEVLAVELFSFASGYSLIMHRIYSAHIDRPMKV